jgi:O-antigen/teichoic acid export membrane protein
VSDQQNSYRQILKATSLFGGVQVFLILIAIIKSKFIAVLLGPAGMGIAGLLTSATGLIGGLTNFGIGTSAVKNVAFANSTGNKTRIAIIVTVLNRWVWITGLLGMIVTIVTAPFLSRLTFGNNDYTFPFIWLSFSLLLSQLCSGQMVLLQGMRKLQYLAKANLTGSILGLVISVPLYYWLGLKGIVPGIIVNAVITLAGAWYYSRKVEIEKVSVSKVRTIAEGKEMLIMGFLISISALISLGANYIVRIFIGKTGGIVDVGLYTAGFLMLNTYVGLIFKAMATDYYPRLSSVSHNNKLCIETINQQAEIAILLLAPIIIIFLVFIKWLIILLYSSAFVGVVEMVQWAALGMLFSGVSWAIAFILLAKGASKLFFWNELIANIYILVFNLLGYKLGGLTGLGISFLFGYIVYLAQVYAIGKLKYQFNFSRGFIYIFTTQLCLAALCFIVINQLGGLLSSIIGMLLLIASILHAYKELDKRIGIKNILMILKNKIFKI